MAKGKALLKGGAIDPARLYPIGEPKYEWRNVKTGTRKEKELNPAWDPKRPKEGVKKFRDVEKDVFTRQRVVVGDNNADYKVVLEATEKMLRRLAHVYEHRNPAMSLGFRVIADDIYQHLPEYDGDPKRDLDEGHEDAQEYTALTILGKHDRYPFPQKTPKKRFDDDVRPRAEEAMEAGNPLGAVYKAGRFGWSAPPRNLDEASFFLGSRPDIRL
jgi:hypothetical protein